MNSQSIAREFIDSAIQTFETNKQLAERAIAQVPSSKMHEAIDPETNSIVVIMKHISGNLISRWTDFLSTDGEKDWRNRDDEFVDSFTSREELMSYWERGWNCAIDALRELEDEDLAKTVTIRGVPHSVPLAIHRSLAHCGYHVGQIVILARIHVGEQWEVLTIPRGQGESEKYNQQNWGS